MKRLFPLILAGIFAAAQQLAAQGYGMGMDSNRATQQRSQPIPSELTNTAPNSTQTVAAKSKGGPTHVSVSVAAEKKGNPATTFPTKTQRLYGSFTTTGTNKGEQAHAVWVNSSTKKALSKIDITGTEPNFNGNVSITAPPTGWPAGRYELDIYLGNKMAARASFTMKQ